MSKLVSSAKVGAVAVLAVIAASCSTSSTAATSASTSPSSASSHSASALTGVVKSYSSTAVELKSRGHLTSVALQASTSYRKGHRTASEADLQAGERVRVQLVAGDSSPTASVVTILPSALKGTIASLSAGGFTITTSAGASDTVATTGSTKYHTGKTTVSVSSVHVGSKVRVSGTLGPSGSFTARSVDVLS